VSETLDLIVDAAIGETWTMLMRKGRPLALSLMRWTDAGRFARWGEVYAGRVRTVDRARRGAFVDLGLAGAPGFLPFPAKGALPVEGALLTVAIAREAARGKGPVLRWYDDVAPPADKPQRLERAEADVKLDAAKPASAGQRAALEEAVAEILSKQAPIPGGGVLTIEPTAALVSIDVDMGGRSGDAGQPERLARALNLAAAEEALRQLRLRNLGGLAAIDFVSMRNPADRKALEAALKEAARFDPWGVQFAPLSKFGVVELSRAQLVAPFHERLCDGDGRKSVETCALEALRAIEREGEAWRGRRILAALNPEVHAWLDRAEIPWRPALTARIGPRFEVEARAGVTRDRYDVRGV
jgi:Ribonuclease G/E